MVKPLADGFTKFKDFAPIVNGHHGAKEKNQGPLSILFFKRPPKQQMKIYAG